MTWVLKIKSQNTLRRLSIEEEKDGKLGLTLKDLLAKIRSMFRLSAEKKLVLTYTDQDNDVVTIGDDEDLYDACMVQRINPLHIQVKLDDTQSLAAAKEPRPLKLSYESGSPQLSAGDEASFQRIDRPSLSRRQCPQHQWANGEKGKKRRPMSSTQACIHASCTAHQGAENPFFMNAMMRARRDHRTKNLNARFVRDVTIFDGTEMAAGTRFTKIWRVRNIGTLPWPQATHLVYTGGDVLGSAFSSFVELPVEGLQCEEEVDVSIDLLAPQSPGRYVSHWRLRAPTGQKFGQRIWVLIQVVSRDRQCIVKSISEGPGARNGNLPSEPMSVQEDRHEIPESIRGAGKPSSSTNMVDASSQGGCPHGFFLDGNADKGGEASRSSIAEY